MLVYKYQSPGFNSFEYISRTGIVWSYIDSILNLLRTAKLFGLPEKEFRVMI